VTLSLALLVTAVDRASVNAALESTGRGPGNLSVPCSSTGSAPATHYAAHTWDDDLAARCAASDFPALLFRAADAEASDNFLALLSAHGLNTVDEDG
jgi:hypothetical protein